MCIKKIFHVYTKNVKGIDKKWTCIKKGKMERIKSETKETQEKPKNQRKTEEPKKMKK